MNFTILLSSLSLLTYTALAMATICSGLISSSSFLPGNVDLGELKAVCVVVQAIQMYNVMASVTT